MTNQRAINRQIQLDSSINISFHVDIWEMALDEQFAVYKFLIEVLTHPKISSILINEQRKKPLTVANDPATEEKFRQFDAILPKKLKKDLDKLVPMMVNVNRSLALNVYSKQMIVISYTLFEGILDEFVTCLFGKYPERMYEYVNIEMNLRGKIDLQEILKAESKGVLVYDLARKSASNFVRGNLGDLIKRLQKLTKNALDEKLLRKMIPFQLLRNQLVHEMSSIDDLPVKPIEASTAINLVNQILLHLEVVAKKLGVSVHRLEIPDV